MRRHLRRWGVVYFLVVLALVLNAVHWWTVTEVNRYEQFGQEAVPPRIEWLNQTFENLQSEVWQVALACLVVDAARRSRFWFRAKDEE